MNKQQLRKIIKEELTKMLSEDRTSDTYNVDGETYTVLYNKYADEDGTLTDDPGFQAILDPSGKPIMRRHSYDYGELIDYDTLDGKTIHSTCRAVSGADFGLADAVRKMKGESGAKMVEGTLQMTDSGQRIYDEAAPALKDVVKAIFASHGVDDISIEAVTDALKDVAKMVEKY